MKQLLKALFLLAIFHVASSENDKKVVKGDTMLGLNTIHRDNIDKIDKDSVITRHTNNLKITKRGKTASKNVDESPDWSYSSFPEEVKKHVDNFKRNMSECLKEVQTNDKRAVRRLSPNRESPVHGECLIACVLKRNGVIEHGKVNKENLVTLLKKFYAKDDKLIKKVEKNLNRCIEMSGRNKDDCMLAARLNECTNDLMANNKHKISINY